METIVYRCLKPYTRPPDYLGATWYGWFAVAGQSRDSDAVAQSNYRRILADLRELDSELLAENIDPYDDSNAGDSTVTDTRCSHWAVGWVETIYVHSSNIKACQMADEILSGLEDYSVYDESDLSELEHDEESESWSNWARKDFERSLSGSLESYLYTRMEQADIDDSESRVDAVITKLEDWDGDKLYTLFHEAASAANVYWEHSSEGPSIRVERVAAAVTMPDLLAQLGENDTLFCRNLVCRFDPAQMYLAFVQ